MTHPYASEAYARAFPPAYTPVYLEQAKSWALKRPIAGTPYFDAMGCYPLTPIAENADLAQDFDKLRAQGLVSLVLVTDPFFSPDPAVLQSAFDLAVPYKEHYLNDFSLPGVYDSKNHHYKVRRALKSCEVKKIELRDYLDEWCALYDALIVKHDMRGIQAFSRDYFEKLCALEPVAVGAFANGALISCQLWLAHEGYVYSHLVASNEEGYRIRAAYAVYDFSLRYFKERGAKAVDLGSGAGVSESSGGLAMLKKGFSTKTAPCYLCGKILNPDIYAALSANKKTAFFPAYRG